MQGHICHHGVEAAVGEGKPNGHIRDAEVHTVPVFVSSPLDCLRRKIGGDDAQALGGETGSIVASAAAELKQFVCARGPQQRDERLGPAATPIEVGSALADAPEKSIPVSCLFVNGPLGANGRTTVTISHTSMMRGQVALGH